MVAKNEISRGERHVDTVLLPQGAPPPEVEVLVVGAGPTGLATALDLHRHGVDVTVVDAVTAFPLARAGAMGHSARTVELFEQWSVADRVRRGWTFPPEWNLGTRLRTSLAGHDLRPVARTSFAGRADNPFSYSTSLRRPQTAVQQAFLDQLADVDVTVAGGWRLVALEQDEDGVTATIDGSDGAARSVRAKYVVGADGGRSAVRTLTGIERSGVYATERHYRFVVRTRGDYAGIEPFPSGTNVIVNDVHSGFLAALSETDWRVYAGPYGLDATPTTDELLALARAAFGSDVELELLDATPYFKSTRIAREFRRGRVALVGDAAHVRTPGGNLGEGFGDVFNLGWKLAAVLRGVGGEALLESYDRERRPHNVRVAAHAKARAEQSERNIAAARAVGFPADDDLGEDAAARRVQIGEILAGQATPDWGVHFDERYEDSPVVAYEPGQHEGEAEWNPAVYAPGGLPGHRSPNGRIDPYGSTLYDRIRSDVALIVLSEDGSAVEPFVRAAEERTIDLEVIHLPDPTARALYGAPFALVRPDHHVAWRGAGQDLDAGAVLDRAYGRTVVAEASPAGSAVLASRV